MPKKGEVTPNRAYYKPEENTVIIELSAGKALVDAEDYWRLRPYRWIVIAGYVATRPREEKPIYLQRMVMNAEKHERVAFRTNDVWDCRKANLMLYQHRPQRPYGAERDARKGQLVPNIFLDDKTFMDYVDPVTGEVIHHGRGPKQRAYDIAETIDQALDVPSSTVLK